MKFKYTIEPPLLMKDEKLIKIEWYVNTKNDFSGEDIYKDLNGSPDRFYITFYYDFIKSNEAFAKAKFIIYNDVKNETIEETTTITRFTKDTHITSNIFDVYPISINIVNDNHFNLNSDYITIELGPDNFYSKSTVRTAVSYRLKDINGNIIFKRDNDVDNLNGIKLNINKFKTYPIILLSVKPHYNEEMHVPETIVPIVFNRKYNDFTIGNTFLKYGDNNINIDNFNFHISNLNYRLFRKIDNSLIKYENGVVVNDNGIFNINISDDYLALDYELVIELITRENTLYKNSFILPLVKGV